MISSNREAEYKKEMAVQQTKLSDLERLVQDSYTKAHPTPDVEEPEVKFEQADLVKDPIGTIERVTTARTKKAMNALKKEIQPVLENAIERGYQGELSSVSQRKYYPYVKDKLNDTFRTNPALKSQAGAVEYAYNMLVGENIEELEKKWSEDKPTLTEDPAPTPPAKPPTAGKPGSAGPPEEKPESKVTLTPDQERVKAKFAALGLELTDKDLTGEVLGG